MAGSPMLIAATVSSSLLLGGVLTLLPSLCGAGKERLGLPPGRDLWLRLSFAAALLLALLLGGVLVNEWGVTDLQVLGCLLAGFAMANLGLSRNFQGALVGAAALGVAGGILHVATAMSMPAAFFPHDPVERAPAATNLGYIFVALGALAFPLVAQFLIPRWGVRNSLLALALLVLFPALCTTAAAHEQFPAPQSADVPSLVGNLSLWLVGLAVFFFGAVETATLTWAPEYLGEIGFAQHGRRLLLAGFWGLFLFARLLATSLHGYLAFTWLVLVLACLTMVVLGNMIGWHNRSSGGIGFLVLAACLGPVFPTMVGLTFWLFQRQPAVAFGLVCALGTAGQKIAEPLVCCHLGRNRIRLVMGVTMILTLIVAVPALVFLVLP